MKSGRMVRSCDFFSNNVLKIILTILKKYEKRLININSKLEECKDMDKYKLYGESKTNSSNDLKIP